MSTNKLLVEIIELFDQFKTENNDNEELSLNDFIIFMQNRRDVSEEIDKNNMVHIAKNVSFMHRYSKFYVKKALKNSLLQTPDEYMYLVALYNENYLSKTEVNNRNVIEKTSGNEILKRLLKAELIGEQKDIDDKRKVQVFITDKGKQELINIFPNLWKAAIMLSGILSAAEREMLLQISEKICSSHKDIFANHKDEELDNLFNQIK